MSLLEDLEDIQCDSWQWGKYEDEALERIKKALKDVERLRTGIEEFRKMLLSKEPFGITDMNIVLKELLEKA